MRMMKKVLCIMLSVLCLSGVFLLTGCVDKEKKEEERLGRYNILAYVSLYQGDGVTTRKFLCELSEENAFQTVELPAGWYVLKLEAKFVGGTNWAGVESRVGYDLDSYTSPEGEIDGNPMSNEMLAKGTYEFECRISGNDKFYPFYAILRIVIV